MFKNLNCLLSFRLVKVKVQNILKYMESGEVARAGRLCADQTAGGGGEQLGSVRSCCMSVQRCSRQSGPGPSRGWVPRRFSDPPALPTVGGLVMKVLWSLWGWGWFFLMLMREVQGT
jgi:hypothetical protein